MEEKREELISKLNHVKAQIQDILAVQSKQVEIVSSFRQEQTKMTPITVVTKEEKIKICAVAFYFAQLLVGILLCFQSFSFGIFTVIFWVLYGLFLKKLKNKESKIAKFLQKYFIVVLAFGGITGLFSTLFSSETILIMKLAVLLCNALAVVGVVFGIKKKNEEIAKENVRIEEDNAKIVEHNNYIQSEYDKTVEQLEYLKSQLLNENASWFPKDYYSLEAVLFFISAIENFKADSIKEAVLLLDDTQYKNEMLDSQRAIQSMNEQQLINQGEMIKQLKFANVLNVANLALNISTLGAIRQNTSAINANSYAVNSAADRTASAMGDATNAANRAAKASEKAANMAGKIWNKL